MGDARQEFVDIDHKRKSGGNVFPDRLTNGGSGGGGTESITRSIWNGSVYEPEYI